MHGVAKASGVRRCVRRGLGAGAGAVAARDPSHSGHRFPFEIFACVVTLGEARYD